MPVIDDASHRKTDSLSMNSTTDFQYLLTRLMSEYKKPLHMVSLMQTLFVSPRFFPTVPLTTNNSPSAIDSGRGNFSRRRDQVLSLRSPPPISAICPQNPLPSQKIHQSAATPKSEQFIKQTQRNPYPFNR